MIGLLVCDFNNPSSNYLFLIRIILVYYLVLHPNTFFWGGRIEGGAVSLFPISTNFGLAAKLQPQAN